MKAKCLFPWSLEPATFSYVEKYEPSYYLDNVSLWYFLTSLTNHASVNGFYIYLRIKILQVFLILPFECV